MCCVIVVDGTDALNFNNLVISAEGAINPIVKKLPMLILFLNIFELFVTKNVVPNFWGKKLPKFTLMHNSLRSCRKQSAHAENFTSRTR
jgi:hypothetical protein